MNFQRQTLLGYSFLCRGTLFSVGVLFSLSQLKIISLNLIIKGTGVSNIILRMQTNVIDLAGSFIEL